MIAINNNNNNEYYCDYGDDCNDKTLYLSILLEIFSRLVRIVLLLGK